MKRSIFYPSAGFAPDGFFLPFSPVGRPLIQLDRSRLRTCTEPCGSPEIRKNARAFFSGQGRCPCRGPAARRWSCGARNKTKYAIHKISPVGRPAYSAGPKQVTDLHRALRLSRNTEKCASIFLGSRTVSLSRSSGETLVVRSTKSSARGKMNG